MGEEQGVIIDTDVLINLFDPNKSNHVKADNTIRKLRFIDTTIFVSIVTEIELLQGSKPAKEIKWLLRELTSFRTITLNEKISATAKQLIVRYGSSHGLKLDDSLIAATALYLSLSLYSFNKKDFRFIDGLNLYEP